MKRIFLILVLMYAQLTSPTLAQTVLNIATSAAEGRTGKIPKFTVWSGTGLSLSFVSTGEHIVKAWLDDPSKLTLDFDTPICNSPCNSATVIHLRRIQPLQFSHLPSLSSTLLTVVTEAANNTRKVYYFQLNYGNGQAKYIAVNINTDIRPLLKARQRLEISILDKTERIEKGLKIAKQNNTDKQNELVFERVETLLAQVKVGMSFDEALRRNNLAPSVLDKLETLAKTSGGGD